VLRRLADAEVRAIALDAAPAVDPIGRVTEVQADLRDPPLVVESVRAHQVTDIIHAGAISSPLLLTRDPATVLATNVDGTRNVLEAARLANVRRLVFLSSSAVYGRNPPDSVVAERSPLRPNSIYGASKAAAEMLVHGYHAVFGLEVVILRPANIYGPRRRTSSLASYLLANALDGRVSRVEVTGERFDLVHVDDVARACLQALDSSIAVGQAYTIGTGQPITAADIIATVRRMLPDCQIDLQHTPDADSSEGRYDVAAAKRDLSFHVEWDLERGLRHMCDVLRDRSDLRLAARQAWQARGAG